MPLSSPAPALFLGPTLAVPSEESPAQMGESSLGLLQEPMQLENQGLEHRSKPGKAPGLVGVIPNGWLNPLYEVMEIKGRHLASIL